MAKTSVRIELNRAAFDALDIAQADALMAVAEEVLARTNPPDAPPYGQGLLEGGGYLGFVGKKKIGGSTIGGKAIKKPRSLKLEADSSNQAVPVGFGFPGRFVELGTVDTPAQPFLTPAVMSVVGGDAEVIIGKTIMARIGKMK